MTVFIWFLCLFGAAIIQALIRSQGFILGGIPTMILYIFTFWLAKTLSNAWKKNHAPQKPQDEKEQNAEGKEETKKE